MTLFNYGLFRLHSGGKTRFKIDCEALTDEDWRAIACLIAEQIEFNEVEGTAGGRKLAFQLRQFAAPFTHPLRSGTLLIVNDVLTTGESMEAARAQYGPRHSKVIGVVLFARGPCPDWITPLFQMKYREE